MDHAPGTKHAHSASSLPRYPPLSPLASPQSVPTGSPVPPSLPALPSPLTTPKTEVAQPATSTLNLVTLAAVATASSSLYFGTPSSASSSPSPQPSNMTVATIAQENAAQTLDASKRHHFSDQNYPQHEHEEPRHSYHRPMNHRGPSTEGLPPFQRRPSSPFNNDNNFNSNYMNSNNNSGSDYDNGPDRWPREGAQAPEEGSHAYARSTRSPSDEQQHPLEVQNKESDHEAQLSNRPYHHQEPSRISGERGLSAESSDPVEGEDQDGHDGEAMSDDDNLEDDESEENEEGSSTSKDNNSTTAKSEEGSDSLVIAMYGARRPAVKVRSMFVDKLFKMVEDPTIQHLISWAKEGDMFYVYNCIKLSDTILPKFFKHNNWQSFVRQLNMYGFHKIYRYDRVARALAILSRLYNKIGRGALKRAPRLPRRAQVTSIRCLLTQSKHRRP
ncbi:hypothetical protein BGZ68_000281 [Mortierella alpina]|nr:hypothetical protein BGZ68_000281 [Mortierella alpina]